MHPLNLHPTTKRNSKWNSPGMKTMQQGCKLKEGQMSSFTMKLKINLWHTSSHNLEISSITPNKIDLDSIYKLVQLWTAPCSCQLILFGLSFISIYFSLRYLCNQQEFYLLQKIKLMLHNLPIIEFTSLSILDWRFHKSIHPWLLLEVETEWVHMLQPLGTVLDVIPQQ